MGQQIGQDAGLDARVGNYLDLVYGAAVRQMRGDASGAEDVAQAVMMVMWRKGREGKLPEERFMTGWLLKVTGYAVREGRVRAQRRERYEMRAGRAGSTQEQNSLHEAEVRELLDAALLRLGPVDREVVARRYLRGESLAEVGAVMGMNENTVGRRIVRALEKLRKVMGRRGDTAPLSVVAGVMMSEALVKAPAGLAAAGETAGSGTAAGIAKTVLWKMVMAKAYTGLAVGTAIVMLLGAAAIIDVTRGGEAAVAAGGVKAPFDVTTETTAVTTPLQADGAVDYVAAINEKYSQGVTAETIGFVVWVNVMGARGFGNNVRDQMLALSGIKAEPADRGWVLSRNTGEMTALRLRPWKVDDHPQFAAMLSERERVLALAAEAAGKGRWWEPAVSTNGTMTKVMLPELRYLDDVGQALCARAMLRAGQGDFAGFSVDVMTVKRLARLASEWMTIARIVGIHLDEYADQTIGAAAGAGMFSGVQCAALAKALDALRPLPTLWEAADVAERWGNLDFAASVAMGNVDKLMGTGSALMTRRWCRCLRRWIRREQIGTWG